MVPGASIVPRDYYFKPAHLLRCAGSYGRDAPLGQKGEGGVSIPLPTPFWTTLPTLKRPGLCPGPSQSGNALRPEPRPRTRAGLTARESVATAPTLRAVYERARAKRANICKGAAATRWQYLGNFGHPLAPTGGTLSRREAVGLHIVTPRTKNCRGAGLPVRT